MNEGSPYRLFAININRNSEYILYNILPQWLQVAFHCTVYTLYTSSTIYSIPYGPRLVQILYVKIPKVSRSAAGRTSLFQIIPCFPPTYEVLRRAHYYILRSTRVLYTGM